jgi:hypothetical protein
MITVNDFRIELERQLLLRRLCPTQKLKRCVNLETPTSNFIKHNEIKYDEDNLEIIMS